MSHDKKDIFAVTGSILGTLSIFLWEFSIFPLLAIVFGILGIFRTTKGHREGLSLAVWGLVLGSIFLILSVYHASTGGGPLSLFSGYQKANVTKNYSEIVQKPAVSQPEATPKQPVPTDTDGDGLSDREETQVYHSNPLSADSDGDGFLDGEEVRSNFNPNGPGKIVASSDPNQGCEDIHGPSIYKKLSGGGAYCDCKPGYEPKIITNAAGEPGSWCSKD